MRWPGRRRQWISSCPSITGIIMSVTTSSGSASEPRTRSRAAAPCPASATSCPAFSKILRRMKRKSGSSSTTKILDNEGHPLPPAGAHPAIAAGAAIHSRALTGCPVSQFPRRHPDRRSACASTQAMRSSAFMRAIAPGAPSMSATKPCLASSLVIPAALCPPARPDGHPPCCLAALAGQAANHPEQRTRIPHPELGRALTAGQSARRPGSRPVVSAAGFAVSADQWL